MGVCVHPIRDLTAYPHYLAKNLKDLRKIHPAPPDWKSRLIRRSNGFSVRSVKELWREYIAELYPNAELGATSTLPALPGEMVGIVEAVLEEEASKGETLQSIPIQL